MPKQNGAQELSLYEQIQQLQSRVGNHFTGFTAEDQANLDAYSARSRAERFHYKSSDKMNDPENAQLKEISERLAALAAHYPKNSPELSALRKHIPDIGRLRKEKVDALRADASRTGMDKLRNDFFGSKKRAAREELARMRQSRTSIDDRKRTNTIKAPEHPGSGRNLFTAITNKFGLGTHDQRHLESSFYGIQLDCKTKHGMLAGVKMSPDENSPNQKVVLVFCGSGEPAEEEIEGFADSYLSAGVAVVTFNYRGFGNSKTLERNGNQIGTPLSEQSIYEDGMEMYKYVRDVMGVSPENITLHGYSMGGAVASHVAANVAEQNRRKERNGIQVPQSQKLGGLVLQSPMKTMYDAALVKCNNSIAAYFGSRGSGAYDTEGNMRRLYANDPDIPVAFISGSQEKGDFLSLERTRLHLDPQAPFKNASCSISPNGHLHRAEMLSTTTQHIAVAKVGRNVQLNTRTIQRESGPDIQNQSEKAPMAK